MDVVDALKAEIVRLQQEHSAFMQAVAQEHVSIAAQAIDGITHLLSAHNAGQRNASVDRLLVELNRAQLTRLTPN